jgi:hypothetical protein
MMRVWYLPWLRLPTIREREHFGLRDRSGGNSTTKSQVNVLAFIIIHLRSVSLSSFFCFTVADCPGF